MKITPADKWFSKAVRARAGWTCQNCGINQEHDKAGLDCSHFVSRNRAATRYHPLNAFAHCKGCHKKLGGDRWGGGNVAEFAHHYDDIYGHNNREVIRQLSLQTFKGHNHHIKAIGDHYRAQFRAIEAGQEYLEPYKGCKIMQALEIDIKTKIK